MIILGRHGNTFLAGSKAVWVGARTDLPLTVEGKEQAGRLAQYLATSDLKPKVVVTGPLRRTREYAEIVATAFGCSVEIDDDLRELDYGAWEGLDNTAVAARFGSEVLSAWEKHLIWPNVTSEWGEGFEKVTDRVHAALNRLASAHQPVFACTSNGILRFVWMLTRGLANIESSKVRTGAMCLVDARNGPYHILDWNRIP